MKKLLLVGGGHAHLRVLAELARRPARDWEASLLTPQPLQIYSGMLPGWVAGHYTLEQCTIDLRPLAQGAGVQLLLDAATALDPDARCVRTRDGRSLGFDLLSLDVGSAPATAGLKGADRHGVVVRPLARFVAGWEDLQARVHASCRPFDAVVLGAGPGGVELALALRHRAQKEGWSHLNVHLAGSAPVPLPGAPAAAQARVMELLRQRCIRWHGGRRATAVESDHIAFADGPPLPCNACWIVTGAAAPQWLRQSGLATDADGFPRVTSTLQSVSHPEVFAAGDASSHDAAVPRSGVYAVRAGAVLARNVVAACTGAPLGRWRPQARALYLLSEGDRRALAVWGGWAWHGRWVWRWKDRIDRRFVRSYAR